APAAADRIGCRNRGPAARAGVAARALYCVHLPAESGGCGGAQSAAGTLGAFARAFLLRSARLDALVWLPGSSRPAESLEESRQARRETGGPPIACVSASGSRKKRLVVQLRHDIS